MHRAFHAAFLRSGSTAEALPGPRNHSPTDHGAHGRALDGNKLNVSAGIRTWRERLRAL